MQTPEQATDDVIYSDLDIDPDTRYFLYVGELKSDCLNPLLRDFLSRKFETRFDFISMRQHDVSRFGVPGQPLYSATEGRFPENAVELSDNLDSLCWRTYNYKTDREVLVRTFIPQACDERDLFRQVAGSGLEHGMIVMEHLGQGLTAEPGTFVGRIAAVSRRREWLESDIRAGKELLLRSISTEE